MCLFPLTFHEHLHATIICVHALTPIAKSENILGEKIATNLLIKKAMSFR